MFTSRRVLGHDYKLLFAGCVVARPGAGTQGLHADGGHLFRNNDENGALGLIVAGEVG